jgi:hypothetical protein
MLAFDFIEQRSRYLVLTAIKPLFCGIVERVDIASDIFRVGTAATAAA